MDRLARSLAPIAAVPGVHRLARQLCGRRGAFEISLGSARFAGSLDNFVDREAYLSNGYERPMIDLFLAQLPRGGVVMDVGANCGNHSALFAAHFDRVLSFEPNLAVLPMLRRNAELNMARYPGRRIDVHPIGLGDRAGELPFFNISNGNLGLGTFSAIEQYDQPLQQTGAVRVEVADDLLGELVIAAAKIDVQGFEAEVLRGMQAILARSRPLVWVELGDGALNAIATRADVQALFPYPIALRRFAPAPGLLRRHALTLHGADQLVNGDYLVSPA